MANTPRTCIAICTCGRPDLLRALLEAIAVADLSAVAAIVIVENHHDRQGLRVAEEVRSSGQLSVPIHTVVEPNAGISYARNRAIESARELGCEALAFIDDDEEPSSNWINELLAVQAATCAEVVAGPVVPLFRSAPSAWAISSGFYEQKQPPPGSITPVNSTANVLILLNALRVIDGVAFDPEFGLSGGSDQVLFTKLAQANVCMAWAQRAIVFEQVDDKRLTKTWVANRAYRNGNINMRAELLFNRTSRQRLVAYAFARASVALLSGCLIHSYRVLSRSPEPDGMVRMKKALGRMGALRGTVFQEYSERHR